MAMTVLKSENNNDRSNRQFGDGFCDRAAAGRVMEIIICFLGIAGFRLNLRSLMSTFLSIISC